MDVLLDNARDQLEFPTFVSHLEAGLSVRPAFFPGSISHMALLGLLSFETTVISIRAGATCIAKGPQFLAAQTAL